MRYKGFSTIIILFFILSGCNSKSAEEEIIKDIEITDEVEQEAVEQVKLFLSKIYSNEDYSIYR